MRKTLLTDPSYRHAINGFKGSVMKIADIAGKAWDAGLVEYIAGWDTDTYVNLVASHSIATLLRADAYGTHPGEDESRTVEEAYREFDADSLDPSDREALTGDAEQFVRMAWPWLILRAVAPEQAGHDLHLTRNRHGAGFWDGDYGPAGAALTEIAQTFSEGVTLDLEWDAKNEEWRILQLIH